MMHLRCGLCPAEVWCILLMLEKCGFSSAQFKTVVAAATAAG